jgi:hypothetical protein
MTTLLFALWLWVIYPEGRTWLLLQLPYGDNTDAIDRFSFMIRRSD